MLGGDMTATEAKPRVLTIGHTTHPIDEFIGLLRHQGVTQVVDIRTLRGSRHCPWFDEEVLGPSLEDAGLGYLAEPRLGGLRPRSKTVDAAVNGMWRVASFHKYADYALGEEFEAGLGHLLELARAPALPVIMCAEAVWWRCHRRIVADHLIARGVSVSHVMPDGRLEVATLTPGGVVGAGGEVTYPAG